MGKNNNNNGKAKTTTVTPPSTGKTDKTANAPAKGVQESTQQEVLTPEVVEKKGENAITIATSMFTQRNQSSAGAELTRMSPDSKVALATLLQKRIVEDPMAGLKYPAEVIKEMDGVIDIAAFMAVLDLRDEAMERGFDLNLTLPNGVSVLQLENTFKMLGVVLPKTKALPSGEQTVNMSEAKVDNAIQTAINNEKKARKNIEEKAPELDPSKITTDEQLKEAVEFKMRSTQHVMKSLMNTIVWLRNYRSSKTTKDEEKAVYENRNIGEWIDDILSIASPTLIFTGIGRTIYVSTAVDKNPVASHMIIRRNTLNDKGEMIFTEEQVADILKTLLKHNALFHLQEESEAMKGKTIADDKAIQTLTAGNETLIEKILSKEDDTDKKIYAMVQKAYFPNAQPNDELKEAMHVKLGQIMNLYLPESERMSSYPSIQEAQSYPEATTTATDAQPEEKKN